MFKKLNDNDNYNLLLPRQILKYIEYELSQFEKLTHKEFFFNLLSDDTFELNIYHSKNTNNGKEKQYNNNNIKPGFQVIYRSNNIHQFIKRLLIFREYLINNY